MRILITLLFLIVTSRCWAAEAVVTDGDTIIFNGKTYRLDGIDAPQTDQTCLDEKGAVWACGIEVRDQLKKYIATRDVRCSGKRSDPAYRSRYLGVCVIEGEATSLNQWLVREGWALSFGPEARKRFKKDQDEARDQHRGLWKGCFSSPHAWRNRDKSGAVLLDHPARRTTTRR